MREDDMLRLSLECARLVVRGNDYEEVLVAGAERILRVDAGAGLTTWKLNHHTGDGDPVSGVSVVVSGISPPGPGDTVRAISVVSRHPMFGRADWFAEPTQRISDVVCLPRFWDSDVWRYMHGYGDVGGRYPATVNLGVHGSNAVFLGVQRAHRDFSDTDMEILDLLRGPLMSALAFRSAWNLAVDQLQGRPFSDDAGDQQVTRREGEVLALVARGWTNRRIGHVLGITERTVRKHLENVNAKLGVSNRAAAASWWGRRDPPSVLDGHSVHRTRTLPVAGH